MDYFQRFKLGYKALCQLGPGQVGLNALYQLGLRSGHYHRQLNSNLRQLDQLSQQQYFKLRPPHAGLPYREALLSILGEHVQQVYQVADEIVHGKVRLFGGEPVPLVLEAPGSLVDWTAWEENDSLAGQLDIKEIWEPGRFGWACQLAMAYHISGDERYSETFWLNTEHFLSANPPYLGPHWCSAQEVALRLVTLSFAFPAFSSSAHTTTPRLQLLSQAVAAHAERIPPTLVYARSQHNNHLISEALGLYTASAVLPDHPRSHHWHALGWHWLNAAFRSQISPDGTYSQHSTNYHRLMLQAALWAQAVQAHSFPTESFPPESVTLLAAATTWLWKLVDPASGRVPNLGHNDGAYILPLTICPFEDYRPVLGAAARAFLHLELEPKGAWDDMAAWLGLLESDPDHRANLDRWRSPVVEHNSCKQAPYILVNPHSDSWASLNAARFTSRPAHADQLHLDLWWHGLNIALDPGTYRYNAAPPWENSLTQAAVHNTLLVDDLEPMQRAGRFLYLDWDQAWVTQAPGTSKGDCLSLTAKHDGWKKLGISHTRSVTAGVNGGWEIIDRLDGPPGRVHAIRLHWLLPDWQYEVISQSSKEGSFLEEIRILSPLGWISLKLRSSTAASQLGSSTTLKLARSGQLIQGTGGVSPITGWTSPTYGVKIPALACVLEISQGLPVELCSEWTFPHEI